MSTDLTYTILLSILIRLQFVYGKNAQPNIVFILADDLGYHDVGYHTPSIHTPNLDRLANRGVRLEQYYTQSLCTVSRAALMTGRYPANFGYQRVDTQDQCAVGLPLSLKLLPEVLKEMGYATHIIGKWHLGFYKSDYLPNNRGFDSFFGFYASSLYHYTHVSYNIRPRPGPYWALDLHNDSKCVSHLRGQYASDIFASEAIRIISQHSSNSSLFLYLPLQSVHTPNEAPDKFRSLYSSTLNIDRQILLGMVSALDESVGRIVSALEEKGEAFWNNTLIIFASDNGGWTKPGASGINYPLRGGKFTLFEGGIRVPAFVFSPLIDKPARIEESLVHVSDWYPTLVRLAGGDPDSINGLDGVDQMELISRGTSPPRNEILHNMYTLGNQVTSAIRVGDWKLMTGLWANCNIYSNPYFCGWIPPPDSTHLPPNLTNIPSSYLGSNVDNQESDASCSAAPSPSFYPLALYNIRNDPSEYYDVSDLYIGIVTELLVKLRDYWLYMSPSVHVAYEWKKMAAAAERYGCLAPWDD